MIFTMKITNVTKEFVSVDATGVDKKILTTYKVDSPDVYIHAIPSVHYAHSRLGGKKLFRKIKAGEKASETLSHHLVIQLVIEVELFQMLLSQQDITNFLGFMEGRLSSSRY